jgi:hypothetical protein
MVQPLAPAELGEEICVRDPAKEASFQRAVLMFSLVAGVGGTAVGLFAVVYGLFFWPSSALLPSTAPIAAGSVVLAGTIWGAWRLRRTTRHILTSVVLGQHGIRGIMADRTPVNSDWSDPTFALDITTASGPAKWAQNRHHLRWARAPGAFAREISPNGFQRLLESAKLHGLTVDEERTTSGQFVTTTWKIRHPQQKG